MKISIDKNELNNLVSTYFKEKYNLEGSVKIDDKGASIEIDMKSLAQISSVPTVTTTTVEEVEEPTEEEEEVTTTATEESATTDNSISSLFNVLNK